MGADNLNLTPAIVGMKINHPLASLGESLISSATITLGNVIDFPESLDKVDNYTRWQRGKHAIKLYLYGALIRTLRLKTYYYDDEAGQAELNAVDILGLLNFDRNKSVNGNFREKATAVTVGLTTYSFIPRVLMLEGVLTNGSIIDEVQYLQPSQIITSNLPLLKPDGKEDGFTADVDRSKRNPIEVAQEIVAALGYWMWCDTSENIRFVKYPTDVLTPSRRYAFNEVEEFKPKEQDSDESPPSTVTAIGTMVVNARAAIASVTPSSPLTEAPPFYDFNVIRDDPAPAGVPAGFGIKYPITTEAKGDGGIVVQRTTRFGDENDPYNRVLVKKSLASLMPDEYPDDNTLVTASDRTIASDYDDQGYLVVKTDTDSQPLGVMAAALFPGSTALGKIVVTERWVYNLRHVPLRREIIAKRPAFAVFDDEEAGSAPTFFAGEIETWTPIGTNTYEHQVIKTVPKGVLADSLNPYDTTPTIIDPTEPDFVSAPPEAPSKPATNPNVVIFERVDVNVAPNGEPKGFAGQSKTVSFSNSAGNAGAIAKLQANIEWQRHAAYNVTRPFDPLCDLDFAPFQREDVHNRSMIRDGYTIVIGEDGLSVSYTGNLLGTIATIPSPYEARAIVPNLAGAPTALTLATVIAQDFALNVPISSIQLVATGGLGTYTFSALGLPPGLSVVGNTIVGIPTAIGVYSVTISVTDSVTIDSEVCNITIAAAGVPIPFWQFTISVEDGSYWDEDASAQGNGAAEDGSYWSEIAFVIPTVETEDGIYWSETAIDASTILLSAMYRECYTSGKDIICINRGIFMWRGDTEPFDTGTQIEFTQCDDSIIILTRMFSGTLSQVGDVMDAGFCPV